jgi:selenocysteine lyase/cysteine desulfurase
VLVVESCTFFLCLWRQNIPQKAQQVRDLLRQAEKPLMSQLLDFVQQHSRINLLWPADPAQRAATVSLLPVKKTPLAVASTLANKGIMAGANHFYAVRLLEAMNIDPIQGVLLLSFVHYTNQDEIERLVSVLDEVIYANHRPIISD